MLIPPNHEVALMKVAVLQEAAPGERRVALVPEAVAKLRATGLEILVEAGAGAGSWQPDSSYAEAGAQIVSRAEALAAADVVLMVGRPDELTVNALRPGQVLLGMLALLTDPALAGQLAQAGVTAVSLDLIPRTLPRAQQMDALSSQANIAGYKAVLVAAAEYGRFFPLLITAAGTARPARVLVLGAGVAGLQAIGTARRLGAVVSGYDVRPETRSDVASLGATFLELTAVGPASGTGGYARALNDEERQAQQEELAGHIAQQDVIITTAQVPGRRPPKLISAAAIAAMAPGSVIVDMGASALGGNAAGSVPGDTVVTDNGVTIVGAGALPSSMPGAASAMYARNISALLLYLVKDGAVALDLTDDLQAGVVVTRDGKVVHPALSDAAGKTDPAPVSPPEPASTYPASAAEPALADSPGGTARVDGTSH